MFSKKGFFAVCLVILTALLITGCAPTTPVAVTGVTLDQATMTLTAGGATGQLVATVAPADATNQSVTWSSTALAVATVVDGVVTPLTEGTTTIIVTTVDGGLTATCTVTVNPALLTVGDSYGGGIVAYILQSGDPGYDANEQHGLIAATADQSTGIEWITGGNTQTTWVNGVGYGGTSTNYSTGQANTNAMKAQTGYTGGAAKVCDDYINTETGTGVYSDWYLPSKGELIKLYINKDAIGGFANGYYWSSSENDADLAWGENFINGDQDLKHKYVTLPVRAIRAF